jgi:hypothetical protein
MSTLESTVISLGFENEEEFHKLVAAAPMGPAFLEWKLTDGTKEGLLALSPRVYEDPYDEAKQSMQALMSSAENIQAVLKTLSESNFSKTLAYTILFESSAIIERQATRLNGTLGRWHAAVKDQ